MRVALIMPPFSASSRREASRIQRGRLRPLPPLGLGYLSAALSRRGHEAFLVDCQAAQLEIPRAARAILDRRPDLVGIAAFTVFADVVYALADEIRRLDPSMPVVVGGPHATAFHEAILHECESVTLVIPGEADLILPALADCLEAHQPVESVPGLMFRTSAGEPRRTAPGPRLKHLDDLPFLDRQLFESYRYTPLPNQSRRRPSTTAITSRGCAWARCRFCYQGGQYGAPYRRRSVESVIAELRVLRQDLGFREVIFWDDNFCQGERWVRRFCEQVIEERLDITWSAQAHVNTVSPEILRLMAAAGCFNVFLGLESGNQALLDLIDKGTTLGQAQRAVAWARDANLEVRGAMMFALPTETPAMAEETIRFACELDVDYMIFMPYHIQPGTLLEELARAEGRVFPRGDTEFDWSKADYVPRHYSGPEEIDRIIRAAYRRFYTRPRYVARAMRRGRDPVVMLNYLRSASHWLRMVLPKRP